MKYQTIRIFEDVTRDQHNAEVVLTINKQVFRASAVSRLSFQDALSRSMEEISRTLRLHQHDSCVACTSINKEKP